VVVVPREKKVNHPGDRTEGEFKGNQDSGSGSDR